MHQTLDKYNCLLTFMSISLQDCNKKFDEMYIYNSNQNELSNEEILNYFYKLKLNNLIKHINIFIIIYKSISLISLL